MKWKMSSHVPKHQPDVGGILPVLARPCTCIGNRSCNFGPAPQVGAKNQVTTRLMFWDGNLTKAVQVWKQMANLDNLMIWEVWNLSENEITESKESKGHMLYSNFCIHPAEHPAHPQATCACAVHSVWCFHSHSEQFK